jgi:hypothetical protein
MANKLVLSEIKRLRKRKKKDSYIRDLLIRSGYKEDDVDDAFSSMGVMSVGTTSYSTYNNSFNYKINKEVKFGKNNLNSALKNETNIDKSALIAIIMSFIIPIIGLIMGINAMSKLKKDEKSKNIARIAVIISGFRLSISLFILLINLFKTFIFN